MIGLSRRGAAGSKRRGSGASFGNSVWAAAAPRSSVSYIHRVSASSYWLYQQCGVSRYQKIWLGSSTSLPGGYSSPLYLQWIDTSVPTLWVDDAATAWAYTGTGWSVLSGNHRTSTAGDYATWTTPDGATSLTIKPVAATNCGYGLISIDGDPTRADLCPTAQQEVDAGRLPSTALVANGGTLNPTDRVRDFYAADISGLFHLADALAPGVHTVRVTATGYKRAASTGTRITIDGGYYAASAITPATASVVMLEDRRWMRSGSAYEFAYRMKIGGTSEWAGSIHGYESAGALTITVDGTTVTMTDGQILAATSSIVINRPSTLHHPNQTGTASVSCAYTLDADGLRISHATTWQVTATPDTCYPSMLTITEGDPQFLGVPFTKGSGSAVGTDLNLGQGAGATYYDRTAGESDTMWIWGPGTRYYTVARMSNAPATLQNYAYAGTAKNFIQDRDPGNVNKAYWTLKAATSAVMPDVANGTVWAGETTYRWAVVTSADAVCSRP